MRELIDFALVKHDAMRSGVSLLSQLLPCGQLRGQEYVALNPRRTDRSLGSFRFNVRTGCWADFACDARGGDIISLVAYVFNVSPLEAAKRLQQLLKGASHERA